MTSKPLSARQPLRISAEARAAIDLYVLEQGPLRLEREGWGYKFVARQEVRLRLKEAEEKEIRAEERERTIGLLADLQALYPDALQILLAFALLYPQIDDAGWGHVDERVAAIRHERTGA